MSNSAFTAAVTLAPALGTAAAFGTETMPRVARRVIAQRRRYQPFLQSDTGSILRPQHGRQIARAETAMHSPKLPLASREVGID
jgi:hypothetical protein